MRVLFVSTNEKSGGAAVAANRIFHSIASDKSFFVQKKESDSDKVILNKPVFGKYSLLAKKVLERMVVKLNGGNERNFSVSVIPNLGFSNLNNIPCDIVHLNWINNGFLSINDISKIKKPIVWTLHDMWPFTGGCHYSEGCIRFNKSCGKCPVLKSSKDNDLSSIILSNKTKKWSKLDIHVVCPSKWIAKQASKSIIFKDKPVSIIQYPIDSVVFSKISKNSARKHFGLPFDKKIILFGAVNSVGDKRKGFEYLRDAINKFSESESKKLLLVVFGANEVDYVFNNNIAVKCIGSLKKESDLAKAYSAADVFVAPSIEDNLPNTVLESLSCYTPVVAFNIGGMPDMVLHKNNGYLAKPLDSADLKKGILWVINNKDYEFLSKNARKKILDDNLPKDIGKRYMDLYNTILEGLK